MTLHAVFGPTGSGKTALAFSLAKQYDCDLLSFDSRKVYKELNIGTHKAEILEKKEKTQVFGIDLFSPNARISAHNFRKCILSQLRTEYKDQTPKQLVMFGGTGLYLDALLFGLSLGPDSDKTKRQQWENVYIEELQQEVKEVDAMALNDLSKGDRRNPRRLVRILERLQATEQPAEDLLPLSELVPRADVIVYLPSLDRDRLYGNINTRVGMFFDDGWVSETEQLLSKWGSDAPALHIMGYKEIVAWLQSGKNEPLESVIEKIQQSHRNYAKRQLTWAKRYYKPVETIYSKYGYAPRNTRIRTY